LPIHYKYKRDELKNFIRNGKFQYNDLTYWTLFYSTNWEILPIGAEFIGNRLHTTTTYGQTILNSTDYIPILQEDYITTGLGIKADVNSTLDITLYFYDANGRNLSTTYKLINLTANTFKYATMEVIPPNGAKKVKASFQVYGAGINHVYWGDIFLSISKIIKQGLNITGIKEQTINDTSDIVAGGSAIVEIIPEAYSVAEIIALFCYIPAVSGATTGNQELYIGLSNNTYYQNVLLRNNYNAVLLMNYSDPTLGASAYYPSSRESFLKVLYKIVFGAKKPLKLIYKNNTNATATAIRDFNILYKQKRGFTSSTEQYGSMGI